MCSTLIIVIITTEKDVFPFLPELMTHLLSLLDNADTSEISMKLKEFSFSCIASIGKMFSIIRYLVGEQFAMILYLSYCVFLTIQTCKLLIQFAKLLCTLLKQILIIGKM